MRSRHLKNTTKNLSKLTSHRVRFCLQSGYQNHKDHNQVKYIQNQSPALKIYVFHTA